MKEQNIVTKIISDAELKAEQIIAAAEANAVQTVQAARDRSNAYREEQLALNAARNDEVLRRTEINAKLDKNKKVLAAKTEALDSVFEGALAALCALSEQEYADLICNLLERYAENGETVVLSENCPCKEKIFSAEVVSKKALEVSRQYGKFAGGLVLVGKGADKNLTFEALVASAREEKQAEVAEKLFG